MARTDWLKHDRLGMFIHFGLYALAARHEWVKNYEKLTDEHYERYFTHFDPDLSGPRDWVKAAKDAGMKYVVLTTKHHEGFCLWDSALTDYKSTNTPLGKDLVREYVDACAEFGMKVGMYHSLIDWHHPDYLHDTRSPRRDEDPNELNKGKQWDRYVDYLHAQVRELLTDYGKVDYIWFDFSAVDDPIHPTNAEAWRSNELIAMIRELQPDILINDRLDVACDTTTPEQIQPSGGVNLRGAEMWEACQTINGSWGYHRDNADAKDPALLIRMLVDGVSMDGNLLLNVGPDARGRIDDQASERLVAIGEWMKLHERSIRGAGPSEFTAPTDLRYTQRGDRLYVHVFAWPMKTLHLPGLKDKIDYAQLLNDASEVIVRGPDRRQVKFANPNADTSDVAILEVPIRQPNVLVPVIEIFLKS